MTNQITVATKTMSVSRQQDEVFSSNIAPVIFATELDSGAVCMLQSDGHLRVFEIRERELEVCL